MTSIRIPPSWQLPENALTPEPVYMNRRRFLATAGAAATGALLLPSIGCAEEGRKGPLEGIGKYPYPFEKNDKYKLDRPLTKAEIATAYNNYYEFTTNKERVWKLAHTLKTEPWTIELAGECKKAGKVDLDALLKKLPQEERRYRFRCVEAWAMAVPWIGVPMKKFLEWAEPTGKAKYVRFVTVWRPKEMPAVDGYRELFPYYEALRLDEAASELTLLATGMYGRRLPNQNGGPVRVITPWKYGYKSPKSVVRIEFTEKRPSTFWNDLQPAEYGFYSNVNPARPHPRWSQAMESLLPDKDKTVKTKIFNGYGEQVAHLYKGMDLIKNH